MYSLTYAGGATLFEVWLAEFVMRAKLYTAPKAIVTQAAVCVL